MLSRVLVATVIAATLVGITGPPVGADCSNPTYTHTSGPVERGGTIRVEGIRWGDACDDTGPPPPGQGVFGRPLEGIEIVLVQGLDHRVVDTVDADADLELHVDVPIPADLEPGPVEVVVRPPADVAALDETPEELVVADAPASTTAPTSTTTSSAPTTAEAPTPAGDDGLPIVPSALAGAAVVVAGGVLVLRARRA